MSSNFNILTMIRLATSKITPKKVPKSSFKPLLRLFSDKNPEEDSVEKLEDINEILKNKVSENI